MKCNEKNHKFWYHSTITILSMDLILPGGTHSPHPSSLLFQPLWPGRHTRDSRLFCNCHASKTFHSEGETLGITPLYMIFTSVPDVWQWGDGQTSYFRTKLICRICVIFRKLYHQLHLGISLVQWEANDEPPAQVISVDSDNHYF